MYPGFHFDSFSVAFAMSHKTKQHKDAALYDPDLRDTAIQAGNYVLVQLANGDIRSVNVDPNSCVILFFFGDHESFTVFQNSQHQQIRILLRQ